MTSNLGKVAVGGVAAVIVTGAVVLGITTAPKSCSVSVGASAATIQADVNACQTTTLAAGTYALTNHIVLSHANETISGAGPTLTHLIQHSRTNVFQITAPGVTVENLDMDTFQFWPGLKPVRKDPVPGTLFSAQSRTSVINVSSESGSGFGFRLTGPNPCSNHLVSGDVASNDTVTNTGTGGFDSIDMDCLSSGSAINDTIHGNYVGLYESSGVTVSGLTVTPGPFENKCGAPLYVTGPANGDSATNVHSNGGKIITHSTRFGAVTNFTQSNVVFNKAC